MALIKNRFPYKSTAERRVYGLQLIKCLPVHGGRAY